MRVTTESVVAAVEERVMASEMRRRVGRRVMVDAPPGAPPLVSLAHRVHPQWALERRIRFLCRLGWVPAHVACYRPWDDPGLPEGATTIDHLALVVHAAVVETDDPALAVLIESLRGGTAAEPRSASIWDQAFDAAADLVDPSWRCSGVPPPGTLARMEAVVAEHDRLFGRRRPASRWPLAREALRWGGETKRRLVR